jgi:hypothetical protein
MQMPGAGLCALFWTLPRWHIGGRLSFTAKPLSGLKPVWHRKHSFCLTPAFVCMHSQRMKFMLYVQGNCSGNPPAGDPNVPLAPLHPGQCVLTTQLSLLSWEYQKASFYVWLHNLYIYAPGMIYDRYPLVGWTPPALVGGLHATHITTQAVQGTGLYFKSPAYLAGAPSVGMRMHCLTAFACPCLRCAVQLVVC